MSFPYVPEYFVHFPKYIPPKTHEEGLQNPKNKIEPKCAAKCYVSLNEYNICVDRVKSRTDGRGNCAGQHEKFSVCVDKCVSHDLFKYLK